MILGNECSSVWLVEWRKIKTVRTGDRLLKEGKKKMARREGGIGS